MPAGQTGPAPDQLQPRARKAQPPMPSPGTMSTAMPSTKPASVNAAPIGTNYFFTSESALMRAGR